MVVRATDNGDHLTRISRSTGASLITEQLRIDKSHFTTHHVDEAVDFVRRTNPGSSLRSCRTEFGSEHHATTVRIGEAIVANHLRNTMSFSITALPVDLIAVCYLKSGSMRLAGGGEDIRASSGDVVLCRPRIAHDVEFLEYDAEYVRIPIDTVRDVAASGSDSPVIDVRFDSSAPINAAMARHWRWLLRLLGPELTATDSALTSPLVTEQMQRLIAGTMLRIFPNTTMSTDRREPTASAAPTVIRRAVDYIEANGHKPLRLAEIADAACTSPRTLQYGFRRYYGTTPLGYAARVRLAGAHRDLVDADPTDGTTVADIARRWGYLRPGHFASAYRTAYGRPPSHTLRG